MAAKDNNGKPIGQLLEDKNTPPSVAGKAVDPVFRHAGSYKTVAGQTGRSEAWLRLRHRIWRDLPEAITNQIDKRRISVGEAGQVLRLAKRDDQWTLAVAIVHERSEGRPIPIAALTGAVSDCLKEGVPATVGLDRIAGVRFNNAPRIMTLFRGAAALTTIYRAAWQRGMTVEDYVGAAVLERAHIDVDGVAYSLELTALELLRLSKGLAQPIPQEDLGAEGQGQS